MEEQGIQFYVNRYLIGHPEEPKTAQDVASVPWLWHPSLQDSMTAVGLAGLANLSGNADTMAMARDKYVSALQQTGKLISSSTPPDFYVTMRSVVLLALFEVCSSPPPLAMRQIHSSPAAAHARLCSSQVVKGTHQSSGSANAHLMGGAALMRSWGPLPQAPFGGFKALMQLCYSTVRCSGFRIDGRALRLRT
jgi:hypothetical protein